ncbi:MAG: fumarate hydratase [Candidatus Bathyarchaeota archaeon]|jgi:fumarate hydratase subunit alpha
MLLVSGKVVENIAIKLLQLAVTELPQDVKNALQKAYNKENKVGKSQLEAILQNVDLAEKNGSPMCQDTGIIIFYIKAGSKVKGLDKIANALYSATAKATVEIPLRPNAVNPFTQKNTGDNIGRNIPYINWEIIPGDTLEITVLPKGGGSENVSALGMLNASQGTIGLKKFVIDTVIDAGAKPCPPIVLGIAVGGGADIAMKLAKATLIKPLGQRNNDPDLANLEKELIEAINSTGIGPMGLGGKTTALDVKLDFAYRHPASYPVGIVVQCWAARRASARIYSDANVEYLSHKVI